MNNCIKTFIESKKLTLSHKRCFNIHIGKSHKNCPTLFVHDKVMKESENEKYLVDYIDKSGNINATIQSRKAKGKGIVTGIMAILTEIPLGSHKMDVAMKLREAMLMNGLVYNSEAWHGLTKEHIKHLKQLMKTFYAGF